jgi:SPP1 family predicted phage head-tail adaptor
VKCCNMSAGMLREPVTFQRQTRTSDGAGGFTETWATLAGSPSRAFVTPVGGREWMAHDRVESMPRLKLVVRYNAELRESDRVLIRSKQHDIVRIDNVEFRNKWLEITVDGGVPS